jgi:hypothetical protein
MNLNKVGLQGQIPTKSIIIGMGLMFLLVHFGFYATYIRHFPEFNDFNWVHHIHGALMGAWVILLLVQPVLIHKKMYRVHRFLGKLTYVLVPILLVFMLLIARENYHSGIVDVSSEEVFARQSITWMQIFMFILFYSLAIYYRKQSYKHLRFMIGLAIVMTGPPMGRIIMTYWEVTSVPYFVIIPLIVKTGIAASLMIADLIKKKDWVPYGIVLSAFILADLVYYARYSEVWQAFGRFVVNTLY